MIQKVNYFLHFKDSDGNFYISNFYIRMCVTLIRDNSLFLFFLLDLNAHFILFLLLLEKLNFSTFTFIHHDCVFSKFFNLKSIFQSTTFFQMTERFEYIEK